MEFILASGSPRRKEILHNAGLKFSITVPDCDENIGIKSPRKLVTALAVKKARAAADKDGCGTLDDKVYIAADTVVFCKNKILGKPQNKEDVKRMLHLLSGRVHFVATGIALLYKGNITEGCEVTKVRFKKLTEEEIDSYANSDEPLDKAGAYAIQGTASRWISGIKGDYFNVVGLPVFRLFELAKKAKITLKP